MNPFLTSTNWRETFRTEWQSFWHFVRHPRRGKPAKFTRQQLPIIAKRMFFLLTLYYAYIVVTAIPDLLLTKWGGFHHIGFTEQGWQLILLMVLVGPVLEELVFRAGLRNAHYSLIWGPVLIALNAAAFQVAMVFALISAGLLLLIELYKENGANRGAYTFTQGRRYIQHYPWIFWAYAIGFALMHVLNFQSDGDNSSWLANLAVTPQLLFGLFASYLRLKHGWVSGLILHSTNNLLLASLLLLLPDS